MKKCLIIINKNAGGSKKINFSKVENCLGDTYSFSHCKLLSQPVPSLNGYQAVAVCGGDGTLSSVLEKAYDMPIEVFYFPVGTLNDKAKSARYRQAKSLCPSTGENNMQSVVIGKIKKENDEEHIFSYVLACGSFTPIGYKANVKIKKKLGIFAYILHVINEYRPHKINATISVNNKNECENFDANKTSDCEKIEGDFTLLMFVKSPRCFGFSFNKAFSAQKESGHLLAIRTPKHGGVLGYIEMFFPFFKAFFIGLKKERMGKNLIFKEVESVEIELNDVIDFCKDGEKLTTEKGRYTLSFKKSKCKFSVIDKF